MLFIRLQRQLVLKWSWEVWASKAEIQLVSVVQLQKEGCES